MKDNKQPLRFADWLTEALRSDAIPEHLEEFQEWLEKGSPEELGIAGLVRAGWGSRRDIH